jgi:glycosyltransferase involved in cell wall biosynthesis
MSVPVVVLDARLTRQMSVGMKTYVVELVKRLPKVAPDLRFIAVMNAEMPAHPDLGIVRIAERDSTNASWGEQFTLPALMEKAGPSVGHYMTPYAARWSRFPYVYTIHDVIHLRYPQYHSWKIPLYYRFVAGPVARAARAVLVPTRSTGADVQRFLGVRASASRVVPLGVSESFVVAQVERDAVGRQAKEQFHLQQPYFLYAGNHRRHKNLETLAAAWVDAASASDLVMTEDGPFEFDIDRYVRPDGRIVRAGHVGGRELIGLYAGCAGAVQPSLYEGFGLSVLEAMAAGAPCIVAETPALLEVAGNAALQFPPDDTAALARALSRLLRDAEEAERLRAAGRARIAGFSWDATARGTAAAYREAIAHAR